MTLPLPRRRVLIRMDATNLVLGEMELNSVPGFVPFMSCCGIPAREGLTAELDELDVRVACNGCDFEIERPLDDRRDAEMVWSLAKDVLVIKDCRHDSHVRAREARGSSGV